MRCAQTFAVCTRSNYGVSADVSMPLFPIFMQAFSCGMHNEGNV